MTAMIFFACFYVIAYLAGAWGDVILEKLGAKPSKLFGIAFGGCSVIMTAVLVSTACSLFGSGAKACALITAGCIVIIAATGIFAKKKLVTAPYERASLSKNDVIFALVAIVAVVLQVAAVMHFRYENGEALRSVATATAVFESGKTLLGEPMMVFTGVIASLTGIHPLKLIFFVFPATFIPFYYICYTQLIEIVCDKTGRIAAFAVVTLLNIWGYQSDVLIGATLLISWSGIWVYVIHGLLNLAAVIWIRYLEGRPQEEDINIEESEEDEEWDMKKHRIINARNLAIALAVLALALIGTVFVLNSKINRLYDATVNLQTDMNSRCSIYEFTDDDGSAAGYLIKGSDGKITFVGGGDKENTEALRAFFERYGNTVTQWYAYGEDEAASGAMRELIDSAAVNVEKVYVIDREEITVK